MYKRGIVKRPTEPPKQPHCSVCLLTNTYLEQRKDTYECSRIDCPKRRGVTASLPDGKRGIK